MDKTIEVDAELLHQVLVATGAQTERQAVEHVLQGYLEARRKHADLLTLIGTVRFCDDYDPRAVRFSSHDTFEQHRRTELSVAAVYSDKGASAQYGLDSSGLLRPTCSSSP